MEPFNITYSDTGLFGAYIVCEPMQSEGAVGSLIDAWHRLSYSITDAELETAKNRLITHLLKKHSSKLTYKILCAILFNRFSSFNS